ncbi:MAG: hypothetical protein HQL31_07195 [Planctomycetes bacterium]|nr:hypothetical protein [Planctomycetota bacterium]
MHAELRSVLWKRATRDHAIAGVLNLLEASRDIYPVCDLREKHLILAMHEAHASILLQNAVEKEADWQHDGARLAYLAASGWKAPPEQLALQTGDDPLVVQGKLSLLRLLGDAALPLYSAYDQSPNPLTRELALDRRPEGVLKEALKDPSQAVALRASLELNRIAWRPDMNIDLLEKGDWNTLGILSLILEECLDKVSSEWIATACEASNRNGKVILASHLSGHPGPKWQKFFEIAILTDEANRDLLLKALTNMPGWGKTDWLRDLLVNKTIAEKDAFLTLSVLYNWKEKTDGSIYMNYFASAGFKNGKPGGASLLCLIGMNPSEGSLKLINSYLNVSEKNPYMGAAVEAAGWLAQAELVPNIVKVSGGERSRITSKISLWALDRCEGRDTPFPGEASTMNPHYELHYRRID